MSEIMPEERVFTAKLKRNRGSRYDFVGGKEGDADV
jgi:hypothetical protein